MSDSDLWKELEEEALEPVELEYREKIFPVEFADRTSREKLLSLVLNGPIPLIVYGLFLGVCGINLSYKPSFALYLLLFPVPICLGFLLAPLFRITELKRPVEIAPFFGYGLLLPLFFAAGEWLQNDQPSGLRAAQVYVRFSHVTTLIPVFVCSLAVAWSFKYLAAKKLPEAPWWDQPAYSKGRLILAAGSMLLPLLVYIVLFVSAQPSQSMQKWLEAESKSTPWNVEYSESNAEAWSEMRRLNLNTDIWEVKRQTPEAIKAFTIDGYQLLQDGRLHPRDFYNLRDTLDELLESAHYSPDSQVKILTQVYAKELSLGITPFYSRGYRAIESALEDDALNEQQLQDLTAELRSLKEDLKTYKHPEDTLRAICRDEYLRGYHLGLVGQLEKRNLGPESLVRKLWRKRCVQTLLELKTQLPEGTEIGQLWRQQQAGASFSPDVQDSLGKLHRLTLELKRHPEDETSFLDLKEEYENSLEILLLATEARFLHKSKGQIPSSVIDLRVEPSGAFSVDSDEKRVVITGPRNHKVWLNL